MAGMFDETMNGLRSVIDSAAKRTQDAFSGSKNYVERAKLRSTLNDYYRRLGKAEYEAAMGGVSSMEEINAIIAKITELRQQMYAMEQNSKVQRGGTVTCPTCGRLVSGGDPFCPGCGTKLQ